MPAVKKWFKVKKYGWGWTPQTFEGYLTLLIFIALYLVLTVIFIIRITDPLFPPITSVLMYLTLVLILTLGLVGICLATGEKPAWDWGSQEKKSKK